MQKLTRGANTVQKARALLDDLSVKKPLIVCSKHLREPIENALGDLPRAVFTEYRPNPDFADCQRAEALFLAESCDGLVSMGGGSAMDTAKCVKALLCASTPERALRGELDAPQPLPHLTSGDAETTLPSPPSDWPAASRR